MTTESLIAQQNTLLQQLIDLLQQKQSLQPLGFSEAPRPRYIYCNRSQNCLWYWLNDGREVVPILQTALTCVVEKLEFKQVERRGKDTWKIHLHVRADRRYILEAGYDSNFSKSLLSALSVMTAAQLQQPVTIEVQAADSDEVLFCRVYVNGELILLRGMKARSGRSLLSGQLPMLMLLIRDALRVSCLRDNSLI